MNELFTELKKSYDVILLDTPQILTLTDAKMMAAGSDGVLLVVEHGKLNRAIAKKIHEDLTLMRANLLGIVFNKINRKEAQTYLS
jgi:Mrp family chromosome partitioning ATPase